MKYYCSSYLLLALLFILNLNINCFASKVTRITGIAPSFYNKTQKKTDEIPYIKLSTPEIIEEIFEKAKKDDLLFYMNISKIRTKNFDKFVSELEKWINDFDQGKINIEREVYKNKYTLLNELLNSLSTKYKSEKDTEKKSEISDQIKNSINALISLTISMDNLSLRIKKKETAKMETALIEKQNNKLNIEKNLIKKYLPDL